jgi:hypothetical protein
MTNTGPELPYYQLVPELLPRYYHIASTATYEGVIELCINYDDAGMTEYEQEMIRMEHFTNLSWCDWAGITNYIDISDNIVCGQPRWLSTYTLARPQFVCGDANHDGQVNIGDCIYVIEYTFKHGPEPIPRQAADANADNDINIGDAVVVINYVFKGGPPPCCP